jgi:hypothetical protein
MKTDEKTTTKTKPKAEKPQPKSVARIAPDVAFIKRYVNLHKKTKTKRQIFDFIRAIQKAIVEEVLRKTDRYAPQIQSIQRQLMACYKEMGRSIKIKLNERTLQQYKAIAESVVVSNSVKIFKDFLRFRASPDLDTAESILLKCETPTTDLEKSVVNSLTNYIKKGTCRISEQALNGIYQAVGETPTEKKGVKKNVVQNANVIVNSLDFAEMEFETLPFTGDFERLIGTPTANFVAMVFGSPGGGKTTLCLMLAEYLCNNHDKQAIFSTIEEGINHTFQAKLKRIKAAHKNLSIANHLPENLEPFDVIILDSVNKFGFDSKKLHSLRQEYPEKIWIWIFQTTKNGLFKGEQEYEHDCDVVVKVLGGVATTEDQKNRFGGHDTLVVYTKETKTEIEMAEEIEEETLPPKTKKKR